jgi:hypothetical protein
MQGSSEGGMHFVRSRKWGWGFGARNPKPSCYGSVLGAPMETAVEVDGRRWWVGAYNVVVAVGRCIHSCKQG